MNPYTHAHNQYSGDLSKVSGYMDTCLDLVGYIKAIACIIWLQYLLEKMNK